MPGEWREKGMPARGRHTLSLFVSTKSAGEPDFRVFRNFDDADMESF
jgi:hypothetical protein